MLRITPKQKAARAKKPPAPPSRRAVALKTKPQGMATDQFFYFFLRLRKGEIRRVVQRAQTLYAGESTEQIARRLILAQCSLSLIGGAVLHLPQLFPGAGNILKLAGFVGGASMMARMNLYLILEIALLYGHDIDDQARVPELISVVAASGVSAATPLLVNALEWAPVAAIPASGLSASAISKLVGEAAIAFYKARREALDAAVEETVPALAG